uniref:CA domain-containing protein n=1 Tax=Macrostomum lignano TaxID=282301 RepID=A0A1I8FHU9_9PLAT
RAGPGRAAGHFERQQRHHATVRAFDLGDSPLSSTAVVTVRVLDENDNAPQFLSDVYNASLPENREPGYRLDVNLTATDADSGDNGRLAYSIESGNSQQLFSLDMSTGRLFARKKADREAKDFYRLTVLATDYGNPPMTGRAEVRIRVLDENDCEPKFDQEEYRFVMQGEMGNSGLSRAASSAPVDLKPAPNPTRRSMTKANVSQQPYLNLYADVIPGNGRVGRRPAADGSVLPRQRLRRTAERRSVLLVAGGRRWPRKVLVDQRGRLRVNINFGHLVKAEEQIIVQACDGGQRTLCGRAKLFVRTVRADQLTPSLLPSNLTAVLAYPGSRRGEARPPATAAPQPEGRPTAAAQPLESVQPGAQRGAVGCHGDHPARRAAPGSSERSSRGLASEQEVRVRVTLLTEAMAESAVRDAQLAEQLTAQLRLGADARVLLLGVQRGSGGGERQRQLMALVAVYEESREASWTGGEVRSRLNSSAAVRSLLARGRRGLRLGAEARRDRRLLVGDGRDHLHGAGVPAGADMRHRQVERRAAVWRRLRLLSGRLGGRRRRRLGAGGAAAAARPGAAAAHPDSRGRGASCGSPAVAAGGWRCGSTLTATAGWRPRPRCPEAAAPKTATVRGCCGSSAAAGERRSWHRVLLRLHDGSPNWTLELLTDSIEPQLGQLPALPASSPSSWDRASTLCESNWTDLSAASPTCGPGRRLPSSRQRRLRLRPRLGAAARRPSWRRPARRRRASTKASATEVGGGGGGFHCSCEPPYAGRACELNLRACDRRPCLNAAPAGTSATGRGGFACDCPAGGGRTRAASWWTAAAAERRPRLVEEVEAPANTAAGAWAAAAAARAPAMLGRCATATSTSADRPS